MPDCTPILKAEFLSTLSARRATVQVRSRAKRRYFYPRSPQGERLITALCSHSHPHFYPRSPQGERRLPRCPMLSTQAHFYPRSPQGERLTARIIDPTFGKISIHALRKESDIQDYNIGVWARISIHALRKESDWQATATWPSAPKFLSTLSARRATIVTIAVPIIERFLSTLSARRATRLRPALSTQLLDFYPRSPQGERRTQSQIDARVIPISIHALRKESDRMYSQPVTRPVRFLSTLSARRATSLLCFYRKTHLFLSTLSARRATQIFEYRRQPQAISIHALRKESDPWSPRRLVHR